MGSFNSAAGKGSSCQILSTTTGGHRTLLAGTRSRRGATLYRHPPTSAAITTVEVIGEAIKQSRDLCIASRPRSLLHCGNDLLVLSAYKAGRAWSTSSHCPFHLAPDRLVEEDPGCGTAGHSGQDPGDDYERAVRRSTFWVRVNHHFLPTARRVLILTLACRWTFSTTPTAGPGLLMTIAFDESLRSGKD